MKRKKHILIEIFTPNLRIKNKTMNVKELEMSQENEKIYPYDFKDIINSGKFIRTVTVTNYDRDDTDYEATIAVIKFNDLLQYLRKGEWAIYLDEFSDREINNAFEEGKELKTKMGSGFGISFGKIPLL